MITLTDEHIHDIMDSDFGATSVPVIAEDFSMMERLGREALPSFTKARSERLVSNYSFLCLDPGSESVWTRFSVRLADELNRELSRLIKLPEPIIFDDLYLTHYEESEEGVGPHRDTNCKNLVVVLVLFGNPSFNIHHDRHPRQPTNIPTKVGELMILRAKQFPTIGFDAGTPLHNVGEIQSGGMLQFGMRQYITKPIK